MAIPSWQRVAAHSHWLWGSSLININGGRFEGYISKTGPGSVPRIAKSISSVFYLQLFQGSLLKPKQVGMFYIIDCFPGF